MNSENCLNDSILKHNQNDNFQTFLIDYAIGVLRKNKNKTKQIEHKLIKQKDIIDFITFNKSLK